MEEDVVNDNSLKLLWKSLLYEETLVVNLKADNVQITCNEDGLIHSVLVHWVDGVLMVLT